MKKTALVVALAASLGPPGLEAQQPPGIAVSGGAGVAWTRAACSYCRRSLDPGPVVYLQAVGPVGSRFTLGAEASLWARNGEVFIVLGSLAAVAHLYPRPGGPLFLRGGLGYVTYRAYDDDGDLQSNGPGVQLGAGYRFQLSNGLAITNFVNVLASRFGTLRSEEQAVVRNFGIASLQLGFGLTRF